jgi:hypothetical protein
VIDLVTRLARNKHTTGAAATFFICSALSHLGPLWFPEHKAQFVETAKWFRDAAVAYGLFMASDMKGPAALPPAPAPGKAPE